MASSPMLVLACSCTAWLLQVIRPGRETDRHTGAGAREPEGAREKGEGRERDTVRHNCSVVHPARPPATLLGIETASDGPCSSWLLQGGGLGQLEDPQPHSYSVLRKSEVFSLPQCQLRLFT